MERYITRSEDTVLEKLYDETENLNNLRADLILSNPIRVTSENINNINKYTQKILKILKQEPNHFSNFLELGRPRFILKNFNNYIDNINSIVKDSQKNNVILKKLELNDLKELLGIFNKNHA